jgi:hypothetical protein
MMIRTIQDLVALTEREVAMDPVLADEILLRSPGCSPTEITELRAALPGLPESYLSVAERVSLPNVSIGYLNLAPGRRQDGSLLKRLTHANSSAWPLWGFVAKNGLYHVADYEGDMICVVREGRPNAGEVLRMDLSCPPTPELHRTAQSFEQLLLGFGSLREQHVEERFGPEAIDEVLTSLQEEFGLDEEQLEDWTWFAEVALGEDESYDQHVGDEAPALESNIQQTSNLQLDDSDCDTDIVSTFDHPVPEGFDAFAAIPSWPDWQIDTYKSQINGSIQSAFYSRFEGRVYQLRQWPAPNHDPSYLGYAGRTARIMLSVIRGTPKPWNLDWVLDEVTTYPLSGFEPWEEAREAIAGYRRRLPDLLAELPK